MRIKIIIDNQAIEWTDDRKMTIQNAIIKKLYEREILIARNKTDAVYNVAAILDVGISTIWKALKDSDHCKK